MLASRLSGAGHAVFIYHLAGAVIPWLLVLATLDIGHMMLHVADVPSRSRRGPRRTAEWGVMINDARQAYLDPAAANVLAGLALFISVMAFNLVGDALRDHLDPHLVTEHAHQCHNRLNSVISYTGRAAVGARRIVNPATWACWRVSRR